MTMRTQIIEKPIKLCKFISPNKMWYKDIINTVSNAAFKCIIKKSQPIYISARLTKHPLAKCIFCYSNNVSKEANPNDVSRTFRYHYMLWFNIVGTLLLAMANSLAWRNLFAIEYSRIAVDVNRNDQAY